MTSPVEVFINCKGSSTAVPPWYLFVVVTNTKVTEICVHIEGKTRTRSRWRTKRNEKERRFIGQVQRLPLA